MSELSISKLHDLVEFYKLTNGAHLSTTQAQDFFVKTVGLKLTWSDISNLLDIVNSLDLIIQDRIDNPELYNDPQFTKQWQDNWATKSSNP